MWGGGGGVGVGDRGMVEIEWQGDVPACSLCNIDILKSVTWTSEEM